MEAYALDRDDLDLYGVHMAVDFVARLRGMVRFDSAAALAEQMRRDVDEARALLGGIPRGGWPIPRARTGGHGPRPRDTVNNGRLIPAGSAAPSNG